MRIFNAMKIVEIKDKAQKKAFLELPVALYKNEKNWIRPLDSDIEGIFDKEVNIFVMVKQHVGCCTAMTIK